ncbi:MAG: acetate uptake transporter [Syntrophomonadaceae bacterium]
MSAANEMKISGHVQELVGNPTPLGLLGLAMVTLVASSQKLGITTGVAYIIPWAIFLGATAQFVAGLMDFKHNNTFGATAFCGYGFFWFAVGTTWYMQTTGLIGKGAGFDVHQLGFGFLGYFIFTVFMTVGAMGTNKVLWFIFFLIDLLFLGLFMSTLGWGAEHTWHQLAAYAELGISICSFYLSGAVVINTQYGYTVLPVGAPFGSLYRKSVALKG